MAQRKRQELIDSFSAIIGDNNSDEAIAFLEDISDSVDDDLRIRWLRPDYACLRCGSQGGLSLWYLR